jgi:hypothetical protein
VAKQQKLTEAMAALRKCGHFLMPCDRRRPGLELVDDSDNDDWTERIGERASTVFVAALALMFAYGYLGHFIF